MNGPMFPDAVVRPPSALLHHQHDGMALCLTPCLERRGAALANEVMLFGVSLPAFAARPTVFEEERKGTRGKRGEKGVHRGACVVRAIRPTLLVWKYRRMAQLMTKPPSPFLRPLYLTAAVLSLSLSRTLENKSPGAMLGGRVAQPGQNLLCFKRWEERRFRGEGVSGWR